MSNEGLRHLTLEQAENYLHAGVITADQWEGYAHVWRTGAPRFSTQLAAYAPHEFATPGAQAVAEELGCCKWTADTEAI